MIKKLLFRIYQKILYVAMFFLNFKKPITFRGYQAYKHLEHILKPGTHVFIVTDTFLEKHDTTIKILKLLESINVHYTIFNGSLPDPNIDLVYKAKDVYLLNNCYEILAIGGGSSMDLAKAVAVTVAKPKKDISKLGGILKVRKSLRPVICIPTTVGTGSEVTLAAVITDEKTQYKYAIMDPVLIPKYAILEYEYVTSLPKHLIAHTGFDALTHALESYLGQSNIKATKKYALSAVQIIFNNIEKAYLGDTQATTQLLEASYLAGLAFTRSYVGNVHAIAHTLGAYYHIPHGLANAVVLPYVLAYYDNKIYRKIGSIYDYLYGDNPLTSQDKYNHFMTSIHNLIATLDIPRNFNEIIKHDDIPKMIDKAYKEANPLYPVPMIFDKSDFKNIYTKLLEGEKTL